MRKPRILIGNIFFSPTSFGGATIVAEHMATRLKEQHDWDVVVVASNDDPELMPYHTRRFMSKGLDVIGVKLPDIHPLSETIWNNPDFNEVFGKILDRVQPDVIHLHSIQNMGATCIEEAKKRNIPVAVTLHDCWFICERQFMINHAGRYCHQTKINMNTCRFCVPDLNKTIVRTEKLKTIADKADLLLYPSAFHRDLHVQNDFPKVQSLVNKNGILPPTEHFQRIDNPAPEKHTLRFGFVGGPGPIKGASVLSAALKKIKRTDYELQVVDAAGNVGQTWVHDPVWKTIPGDVRFIPPYNQNTMDDVFGAMDVLLFPSQWKESFGLTVREAMARGVWVLATEAGGLVEDCIPGKNSTIIPMDGDPDKLAKAISDLLENPPGKDIARDHIVTIADQATELNSYLRDLLPKPRAKRANTAKTSRKVKS